MLNRLTAVDAVKRIARRELTAEALVRACFERIEMRESIIQAWVCLDPEEAIAEARRLDRGALRGALHGLPLGVKDLIDTVQFPTAYGSSIYAGYRPPADAACVAQARRQGALVIGKTVTTEFAGFQPGLTRNPWNVEHTPGGSSSGSAAAVADAMVPLAFGTQTAGSIIRPAAYCGVVGFKPSVGLIDKSGIKPLAASLDTAGVLARNVADVALLAGTLARCDLSPRPVDGGFRVSVLQTHQWSHVSPGGQQALRDAVVACEEAGGVVRDMAIPSEFESLLAIQTEIMAYEAASHFVFERETYATRLSRKFLELLDFGASIPFERHRDNIRRTRRCRHRLRDVLGDADVVLMPSTLGEAPSGLDNTGDPWMNRMTTLLGVPCIHLPTGLGVRNLPVGAQFFALEGNDRALLSIAGRVFSCLGWDSFQ